jgi:hypothetical protein
VIAAGLSGTLGAMTLTLPADTPAPYVYVDNRAFVLSNGRNGVLFNRTQGRWLAEGLAIIADERRSSRMSQHHVFGGFMDDVGGVTLFAGTHDDVVSVQLSGEAFAALRAELGDG